MSEANKYFDSALIKYNQGDYKEAIADHDKFLAKEHKPFIQLVDRIDSVIDNMQNNKLGYKKLIKE